jgi:hypothetical protein
VLTQRKIHGICESRMSESSLQGSSAFKSDLEPIALLFKLTLDLIHL